MSLKYKWRTKRQPQANAGERFDWSACTSARNLIGLLNKAHKQDVVAFVRRAFYWTDDTDVHLFVSVLYLLVSYRNVSYRNVS